MYLQMSKKRKAQETVYRSIVNSRYIVITLYEGIEWAGELVTH